MICFTRDRYSPCVVADDLPDNLTRLVFEYVYHGVKVTLVW